MARSPVHVEHTGLSKQDEERLVQELGSLFPEARSSRLIQFSEAPPTWVRILADGPTWLAVFKVGAVAFLAQMGKHMADAAWGARTKVRPAAIRATGAAVQGLQHLYSILRRQKESLGRQFSVSVAMPAYGQWDVGTHMPLDDEGEFVDQMSLFVSRVDGITRAVKTLHDAGCVPVLAIECTLTDKGFRLTWVERSENVPYEWEFDASGTQARPRHRRPV